MTIFFWLGKTLQPKKTQKTSPTNQNWLNRNKLIEKQSQPMFKDYYTSRSQNITDGGLAWGWEDRVAGKCK